MAFSLSEISLQAIEIAMHPGRLKRYTHEGNYSISSALRLYYWNCELCEAFYFPLQIAEVLTRNAIHQAVHHRYGEEWYAEAKFVNELTPMFRTELGSAVVKETEQHGRKVTAHHIVSGLTFGFWEGLCRKNFRHLLWRGSNNGLAHQFPNAAKGETVQSLHDKIQRVRQWRNRIFHHRAIFDKEPLAKYAETLSLINWMCAETAFFVKAMGRVEQVHARRPF